jgi:hypothetical protein
MDRAIRRRPYTRHGLHAVRAKVKVAGLAAIDRRTAPGRTLIEWRTALIADLGGQEVVSAQQLALIEIATRTRLYIDHLDAFLMTQRTLVNVKRKAALPLLRERQSLVDSLARILGQLGLERRSKKALDLNSYIAEKYAADAPASLEREKPDRNEQPPTKTEDE